MAPHVVEVVVVLCVLADVISAELYNVLPYKSFPLVNKRLGKDFNTRNELGTYLLIKP